MASALEARLVSAPILQNEYTEGDDVWNLTRGAIQTYLEHYRDEARLIGVIEQVPRYDEHVAAGRAASLEHFVRQWVHNIALLQRDGSATPRSTLT